jgi:hypothetical protein
MAVKSHYEEKQLNELRWLNSWAREKGIHNDHTEPYLEPAQVLLAEKAKVWRKNPG